MGAGGSKRPKVSTPPARPSRIESIDVAIVATARFSDGLSISVEREDFVAAYDAILVAARREYGP